MNKTKTPLLRRCFCFVHLVAGAGFEPAARGYEPREIPLLHPAILPYRKSLYRKNLKKESTRQGFYLNIFKFAKHFFKKSDDAARFALGENKLVA